MYSFLPRKLRNWQGGRESNRDFSELLCCIFSPSDKIEKVFLLKSLTDSEESLGMVLGKGIGKPGCLTGNLGADYRVLSKEMENTNTVSKCLFRKNRTAD